MCYNSIRKIKMRIAEKEKVNMNIKIVERHLNGLSKIAITNLERSMAKACDQAGISVVDIVGDSYAYVSVSVLKGRVLLPKTSSDLYRLMYAKAKFLLRDAKRLLKTDHGKRSVRARESIDKVIEEYGREVCEYASYEVWRNARRAVEQAYQYRVCRKVLDEVCAMRRISLINRRIYKAVILHEMPRDVAASRFGTTRNNVDQIVSRVTKGLREDGRRLYYALYNEAA